MQFFKVRIPIAMAFTMAVFAIASTFVASQASNTFIKEAAYWSKVVSGMTMFIGAYSLLRVHYNKIKRQQKGWGYSGLLYTFFTIMLLFGLMNYGVKVDGRAKAMTETEASALAVRLEQKGASPVIRALVRDNGEALVNESGLPLFSLFDPGDRQGGRIRALVTLADKPVKSAEGRVLYVDLNDGRTTETVPLGYLGPLKPRSSLKEREPATWLYQAVQRPASATQYSLLGFFICSAAYRTFRAKTPLAAVLLVSALIVMLGQVPIAALIWDKIPLLSGWLLDIPNMAVKRAILFGICVGSVGTSLRVMFGIERSYMGGD